jgi:hypothetical protein
MLLERFEVFARRPTDTHTVVAEADRRDGVSRYVVREDLVIGSGVIAADATDF